MRILRSAAGVLTVLLTTLAAVRGQATADVAPPEIFDIPSSERGILLHLEHSEPAIQPRSRQVVVLVHGNFFPASTSFGVELPGGSLRQRLADAGLSVYTLDLRGYGGSTRPAFMNDAIGPYVPFATTADAQRDVASALAFIRGREHVQRISLVGWSWGAAIVGEFASKHAAQVDKLVLYGPGWLSDEPVPPPPASGSYRVLDRAASRERVLNGVPPGRVEEIHPSAWFDKWWTLNLRYDEAGSRRSPPVVRAPSGVTQAFTDFWAQGRPAWEPRKVRSKTLVVVGEWDRNTPVEGARAVYDRLEHATSRELKILPEATHFAVLEKNRGLLLDALAQFLGNGTAALTAAR
ncbi:MAG: alpha/beta hydrolase [Myxococcaceae bacterium]|nr:alpha/beta hydrolase [Myxococcaceae bacterium]